MADRGTDQYGAVMLTGTRRLWRFRSSQSRAVVPVAALLLASCLAWSGLAAAPANATLEETYVVALAAVEL
jgi:hypothetical protein